MHLLFLHQYFCPPGGSGNNRSLELARNWVKAGHQVTFITSAAYFPESRIRKEKHWRENVDGIEVHVLNVSYSHMMSFRERVWAWIRFYRKARRYASRIGKVDLIYASSTPLTIGELGRKLAKKRQVPYVYECVDVWPDVPIGMGVVRNRLLIRWFHRLTNRIYREAAEVVTLSEGMKAQILSHDVPSEKVHVIHNGTDPQAFPYIQREPGNVVEVIYTGTVGIANDVSCLVDAARYIHDMGRKDIRFTVLGEGNDLQRVKDYAAGMNLPNLRFLNRVPKEEVAGLLAESDIGVVTFAPFPVLEANSANKFYDYLASGLPVVLNYEGWQAKYLREYEAGLSTMMGVEGQFARNILKLADNPDLRREMGRNGRRLVEEKFDRNVLAGKLLNLFEKVLGT